MLNHSKSIHTDEQLDEALDAFEQHWSATADYLRNFVATQPEISQPHCLVELIRVDIDRRYASYVDVDLQGYLVTFPELNKYPQVVSAIGFEDFRSRRSRNLPLSSSRYRWIPGIGQASWFVALQGSASAVVSSGAHDKKLQFGTAKGCGQANEALEVRADSTGNQEPRVGAHFGEFHLLAVLGQGTFSTVFLATQLGLASRYVALKVVRRLLGEPTHLARLQHTGIVPLFSLHRIGDYSALCMPYFGSATLADWFASNAQPARDGQSLVGTVQSAQQRLTSAQTMADGAPLNTEEVESVRVWNASGAQPLEKLRALDARQSILWLARRLSSALAHAHERGVVHGDLKPANVLIRNDGEPALIDFNLSKSLDGPTEGWAGGTLPYMSPEQMQMLLGQATRIDACTDVYAWGVILFELVEHRLPYPPPLSLAESDVKLALDNRQQPVRFTSPTATAGLKAIIRKCLSFSPSERYVSAVTLLEDVELEFANRRLIYARESLIAGRVPKLMRRYPRLFSAGPVAVFGLLASGLLASLVVIGWNKNQMLDAQARLANFRVESQLLLTEMLDPAPTQWQRLLTESTQLTDRLFNRDAESFVEHNEQQIRNALCWLSPSDRVAAQDDLLEFCLTVSALTCSSAAELTDSQRDRLHQLLWYCSFVPASARVDVLLSGMHELIQHQGRHLPARYESMMRAREQQLDATDSHDLIELLQARTDVRQGQALQAMDRLRSINVNETPGYLYWMILGDAEAQLGQHEAATMSYGLAIGAAPKSVAAFVQRAEALQQLRNFEAAERDYSRAIALAPSMASLYMRRALVREKLSRYDEAIRDMDTALELEPSSNRMLFSRARMHRLANHPDKYQADFRRGVSITPRGVEDWVSRALAQLPRYPDKAKADLNAALQLEADSILVLQNLAHVESEHLHNTQAAMTALDQILELSPENELARAGRSVLLARQNRLDECLHDLEVLSQREQKLVPSILYQMGCAYALISPKRSESTQQAMRFLALAIRGGYGADVIASDPDLDPVREQAEFAALSTVAELTKSTKH